MIPRLASVLLILAVAGAAQAQQTVFDGRRGSTSIAQYREALDQRRLQLNSPNSDVQEDAFEVFEGSLDRIGTEGDSIFVYEPLTDFVVGAGQGGGRQSDDDMEWDVVVWLIDAAEEDDLPRTRREYAVQQLARIAVSDRLHDADYREEAINTLRDLAESPDAVIAHNAFIALRQVIVSGNASGGEAEDAAYALTGRMDADHHAIKRAAFREVIRTLEQATGPSDAVEVLWEGLVDYVDDLEARSIQQEMRTAIRALITARRGTQYADAIEDVEAELADLEAQTDPTGGPLDVILDDFQFEENKIVVESLLMRMINDARGDRGVQLRVIAFLATQGGEPDVPAHKLQAITEALAEIARQADSAMVYARVASALMTLAVLQQERDLAVIPLAALGTVLSATEHAALVVPVMEDLAALTEADLPIWLKRRFVSLIYLQAGDAVAPEVRRAGFDILSRLGRSNANWAVRLEALRRMQHLSRHAQHGEIRDLATGWQ